MDNWYLQKGDQRLGPMTLEALKAMAASLPSPTSFRHLSTSRSPARNTVPSKDFLPPRRQA